MPVFLTDFGLARATATGSRYTRTGEALGTPHYMSPEQACGDVNGLGPPTDVWSLGCILYELLAGRTAFEGHTGAEVIAQVMAGPPADLRRIRPDVPAGLDRLARAALARRAADRPATATAFRDDLDRILAGRPPLARAPARVRPGPLVAVAAVALVATALAIAWGPHAGGAGGTTPPRAPADDPDAATLQRARERRAADPSAAAELLTAVSRRRPRDRALQLELAACLREAARWVEAGRVYDALVSDVPHDPSARLGRGLCRWLGSEAGTRDLGDPLEDLRAAANALPGPEGTLARAILAFHASDFAVGQAEIAAAGDAWEASLVRALLFHHAGHGTAAEQQAAIRAFTRAIETGPPLAWVLQERGHARDLLSDHAGAETDCSAALALEPRRVMALMMRANAREAMGRFAAALADYDAALEIEPGDARHLYDRALARHHAGDLAGALTDYDAALVADPRQVSALSNRGLVRMSVGDLAGARTDLDAALALDARQPMVLVNRAGLRGNEGDLDGSRADLDAAIGLDGRLVIARLNRAALRRHLGDMAGALEDFDAAVASSPEDVDARAERAALRREMGDLRGALEDYTFAIGLEPTDRAARYGRANVRRAMDDTTGARADLDAILESDADFFEARALRGAWRLADGDAAGALADLAKALATAPADWALRGGAQETLAAARTAAGGR